MKRKTARTDILLLALCTAASVYGTVLVYSAGGNAVTQLICLAVGVLSALAVSFLDYRRLAARWYLPVGAVLILVLLTFTPLGYTVPGTDDRNWLYLNIAGQVLLFQPSELLKIVFVLTFAKHLATVEHDLRHPATVLGLLLHGAVPIALVIAQGDDGNAAVLLLLCVSMLFIGGIHRRYLLLGTAACGIAAPVIWHFLSDDKKARFLCLFQIDTYRYTAGWQQDVAITAIGSGRLWGLGFGNGGAHDLYARHNDFIFTVAGEELGFIGAFAVLIVLLCILLRIGHLASQCHDRTGQLIGAGMIALIGWQVTINIGMSLRLFPVLGITLPFFSAGGSSLLAVFLGIGLCLSVYRYPQ